MEQQVRRAGNTVRLQKLLRKTSQQLYITNTATQATPRVRVHTGPGFIDETLPASMTHSRKLPVVPQPQGEDPSSLSSGSSLTTQLRDLVPNRHP